MSRQRFIALAFAALLAISGAMYLSSLRNLPRDVQGALLLPSLASELNTVTTLSVRRGSATPTATVHEQAGKWTVAERADYPADVSKLRKLLLALSDAKIVEQKTSNPASYAAIGVEDPASAGATGAEISFVAKDGTHSVIIGKPVGEGNFARRGGENTSYSVEPSISFEAEPRYWIDSRLLDIKSTDIQSIAIKPATGPAYTVHRAAASSPAAGSATAGNTAASSAAAGKTAASSAAPVSAAASSTDFALDGVPAGRKAADPATLAPSPTALSGLTADDVSPAAGIDFSKATVATVTLTGGNVLTITGTTVGDKHWVSLQASKDAALSALTAGRAFELAGYRFDAIFRPLEQLLVPKEPPPGAHKPDAGNPSLPGNASPLGKTSPLGKASPLGKSSPVKKPPSSPAP
jgi:Domain of unknown function (DUF4340)